MAILLSFLGVKFDIPEVDWWRKRRDMTGHRSEIFAFVDVARAKHIHQMGFDESQVDGVSTCNLWVRITNADDKVSVLVVNMLAVCLTLTRTVTLTHHPPTLPPFYPTSLRQSSLDVPRP